MRSHVCDHPNGKSHICDCKLPEGHGSFQNGCTKYGPTGDRTQVEPGSSSTQFVRSVHNYESDPQSGAGNCKHCGWPKESQPHPHVFTLRRASTYLCVCGLSPSALMHQMTQI